MEFNKQINVNISQVQDPPHEHPTTLTSTVTVFNNLQGSMYNLSTLSEFIKLPNYLKYAVDRCCQQQTMTRDYHVETFRELCELYNAGEFDEDLYSHFEIFDGSIEINGTSFGFFKIEYIGHTEYFKESQFYLTDGGKVYQIMTISQEHNQVDYEREILSKFGIFLGESGNIHQDIAILNELETVLSDKIIGSALTVLKMKSLKVIRY